MIALRSYADTQKATASKERLMVMLFNAALGHMRRGADLLEQRQRSAGSQPLIRAGEIVALLRKTLDPGRDLALCHKLTDLYTFVEARLIMAYSSGDPRPAREAERVFSPIAEAFSKAVGQAEQCQSGRAA